MAATPAPVTTTQAVPSTGIQPYILPLAVTVGPFVAIICSILAVVFFQRFFPGIASRTTADERILQGLEDKLSKALGVSEELAHTNLELAKNSREAIVTSSKMINQVDKLIGPSAEVTSQVLDVATDVIEATGEHIVKHPETLVKTAAQAVPQVKQAATKIDKATAEINKVTRQLKEVPVLGEAIGNELNLGPLAKVLKG